MISNFLHELYHLDIHLSIINNKVRVKYKKNNKNKKTIEKIRKLKPLIIKRFKENELASLKGFTIYHYGALYEYRYGLNSYIFIERLEENKTVAYRSNYRQGDSKPYKTKIIANNVSFDESFHKAVGFIDWLDRKRGGRYIS